MSMRLIRTTSEAVSFDIWTYIVRGYSQISRKRGMISATDHMPLESTWTCFPQTIQTLFKVKPSPRISFQSLYISLILLIDRLFFSTCALTLAFWIRPCVCITYMHLELELDQWTLNDNHVISLAELYNYHTLIAVWAKTNPLVNQEKSPPEQL